MIKTHINQQGKQFVFVEVPEDVKDIVLSNSLGNSILSYKAYSNSECVKFIPTNEYQIIGLAKDFTDDECSDLGIDLLGLLLLALGFEETDNVLILEVL